MARSTAEWIGKTDNAKIPPRIRQKVFDRAGGVCHWCKLAIKVPVETWQADHVVALINGGEHRDTNLAPIHGHCHVAKTGADVADKKKVAAVRKKHLRIVDPPKMQSAGFPKTTKSANREARAASIKTLPPRRMFARAP